MSQVLGADTAHDLIEIHKEGEYRISGFIAHPKIAKPNKKYEYLFVNNRPISDYTIAKAVKEGYHTLIPRELYPMFVVHIQTDPKNIDVNVHPRKTEVKFENHREVFLAVKYSVQNTLEQNNLIPSISLIKDESVKQNYRSDESGFIFKPSTPANAPAAQSPSQKCIPQASQSLDLEYQHTTNLDGTKTGLPYGWQLLGQLHNSYLIVQSQNGLLLIDQHAAAERINYERILKQATESTVQTQKTAVPVTISLSAADFACIQEALPLFTELGFEIEEFGANTVAVHGIPHDLSHADISKTITDMIADMQEESFDSITSMENKKTTLLKYAACRGSIMFGDPLSLEEQEQLLKDIPEVLDTHNTCPHGRPFMIEVTLSELEKKFYRSK